MSDKTYNGWANYATWRVNLELFNGFDASETTCDTAYELMHYMRDRAYDMLDACPDVTIYGWASSFLKDVDWMELARHHFEETRVESCE